MGKNKTMKPIKLESGYYVIENENKEVLKSLPDYNTCLFEREKSAIFTIQIIKTYGIQGLKNRIFTK